MQWKGVKFKHVLLLVIAIGIILRIWLVFNSNAGYDATYYVAMGRGFSEEGEFVMEWGDFGGSSSNSTVSNHFSPAFAFLLASSYSIAGYGFWATRITSIVLSLVFLLVAFFTTKNLYGTNKALVVTAFFSVCFPLIHSTRIMYSENLVMIFFMLTMWAIIRGIDDDRYMVWAGLFAGFGYLTKASVGYFFIIAGGMGFLWRFYYLKWEVLKRRYYLLAIVIFLVITGLWSLRNIMLFGFPNWETSCWVRNATNYSLGHPFQYLKMVVLSLVTFAFLFFAVSLYFAKDLKATLGKIKIEHYSGLWLAVFIVFVIGILMSGAFAMVETVSVFTPDRVRYIVVGFIPISWLAVKDTDFRVEGRLRRIEVAELVAWIKRTLANTPLVIIIFLSLVIGLTYFFILKLMTTYIVIMIIGVLCLTVKSTRKRLLVLLMVFLLVSINIVTEVRYSGAEDVSRDLNSLVEEGDTVAICTSNKYALYPYLEEYIFQAVCYNSTNKTDWIISNVPVSDDNYTLVRYYKNQDTSGIIFSGIYYLYSYTNDHERYEEPEFYLYVLESWEGK